MLPGGPPISKHGDERVLDQIPYAVILPWNLKDAFRVFITDRRLVFVRGRAPYSYAPTLGGVAEAIVDEIFKDRGRPQYAGMSPSELSDLPGSKTVYYESIERLAIRREALVGGEFVLRIRCSGGHPKRLKVLLYPPREFAKAQKQGGARWKDLSREYGRRAQDALRRQVPPDLEARSEWRA